jgi:hypothetical protein
VNNHQQIINRFPGIINMPVHECVAVLMGGGVNNLPIIYRSSVGIYRCCRGIVRYSSDEFPQSSDFTCQQRASGHDAGIIDREGAVDLNGWIAHA